MEKIIELKEKIILKEKYERQIVDIEKDIALINQEVEKLKQQYTKEQKDVDVLEKISFKSLFLALTGDKKLQLSKEKQEAAKAQFRFLSKQKELDNLYEEKLTITTKLEEIYKCEREYESLLENKIKDLINNDCEQGVVFKEMLDDISKHKRQIKEYDEAISAGESVEREIKNIVSVLKSAENWGTFDLFGGGLISSSIKLSKIEEVQNKLIVLKRKMKIFNRELSDISMNIDVSLNISNLETFGDIWFDGFLFDLNSLSKIQEALSNANKYKVSINNYLRKIKSDRNTCLSKLQQYENQYKEEMLKLA